MSAIRVAILGAGGFAREVLWLLRDARAHGGGERFEPVAFVGLHRETHTLKGLPVLALEDLAPDTLLVCGIGGMPEIKERAVLEARSHGLRFAPAAIAAGARVGPDVSIGEGTLVCAGSIITVDVSIGCHVAINLDCTVGHDAILGDFCTLSPGVHVSGRVVLGRGCYLGTNAAVLEGLTIGERAVLGAGAMATRDVPAGALAVGVPALVKKTQRELAVQPHAHVVEPIAPA